MTNEQDYEIDYEPQHFLRCHSKQRQDAADVQTVVWQCAFEPSINGVPSNIVATCGGNSVCFIDVDTGAVKKKFYASNSRENFLALAWTTLKDRNILAAGGSVQTINFIAHKDGFCFHEEKFSRSLLSVKCGITSLLFHPKRGNIMYCSCSNGKVFIFDIGNPEPPDFITEIHVESQVQVSCEVFLLIYYQPRELLLGTSDDGIYCWFNKPGESIEKDAPTLLQFVPTNRLNFTESPSLVDTADILENGLVASKCALHGAIYIWNIETVLGSEAGSTRTIRIVPLYILEWSNTDNYFMYLGYDSSSKLLACGDDKGTIWMYNIQDIVTEKRNPQDNTVLPTVLFEWPNLHDHYSSRKRKLNLDVYDIVLNKTILSKNAQYLVAVTNNNMVCIWKRKK